MWKKVKLNDLCQVITCGVAKRPEYINDGIPFLSSLNVKENKIILNKFNCVSKEDHTKLTKYAKPEKEDILYTRVGSFGEAAVIDIELEFSIFVSLTLIKPKKNLINSRYLMWYLNSSTVRQFASENTSGIGVQNLNVSVVRKYEIPLPPLPIQEKIAEILDKADELRRKDKELQEKYDQLAQAIFIDMFGDPVKNEKGWEVKKVIDECECIVPGRDKPKSFSGDIQWVTTDDLNHLNYTSYSKKKVGLTLLEIKEVNAKIIPKYSVIITCVGNLGICSVNIAEIVINQQLHAFLPRENINSIFLMFNLSYQKGYMNKMASSTTVPYMNKTVCNNIPIIVPPIHLQEEFAKKIELINQLKAQTNATKSEELFQSLLQKAFKGELVS